MCVCVCVGLALQESLELKVQLEDFAILHPSCLWILLRLFLITSTLTGWKFSKLGPHLCPNSWPWPLLSYIGVSNSSAGVGQVILAPWRNGCWVLGWRLGNDGHHQAPCPRAFLSGSQLGPWRAHQRHQHQQRWRRVPWRGAAASAGVAAVAQVAEQRRSKPAGARPARIPQATEVAEDHRYGFARGAWRAGWWRYDLFICFPFFQGLASTCCRFGQVEDRSPRGAVKELQKQRERRRSGRTWEICHVGDFFPTALAWILANENKGFDLELVWAGIFRRVYFGCMPNPWKKPNFKHVLYVICITATFKV